MAAPDLGTGSTIDFGTSSYSAALMSVSWSGITRPAVKTSHMGSTVADAFIVGDFYDAGEIQATFQFDGTAAKQPPIGGVAEIITIVVAGDTGVSSWRATGFISDTSWDGPLEDLMIVSCTIKTTGAISIVDGTP